jgi:hypothetical protein
MSKTKAQLRLGMWPDGVAPARHHVGLTAAARRLAAAALEELGRLGVTADLDKAGRAHFRAAGISSRDARLVIERYGDLVEAFLKGGNDEFSDH